MKRLLSITISVFVLINALAGCQPNKATSSSEEPSGTSTVTDENAEPTDIWAAYPEPVKVKLAVPSSSNLIWPGEGNNSYSDNVWTQAWKEDFNIEAEIIWDAVASTDAYNTKLNLAIASGQLPDIIVTGDYSQFSKLQSAGKLAPLDNILEKNNYDLINKNLYGDGGVSMKAGNVDGAQYGVPVYYQDYRTREVFIRKDWMDELGLEDPKTMEDVIEIGKTFVDKGKATYALPLFNNFIDGFGDIVAVSNSVNAYPRTWIEKDGALAYGSIQPEMKDALSIYADLYTNKYIDNAFSSLDSGALATQITSGQIGVLPSDYWVVTWPLNSMWTEEEQLEWNIYSVMPFTANDPSFKIQSPEPTGKMVAVNADYDHPEVLMKLLNFTVAKLSDPERADTKKFHSFEKNGENIQVFSMNPLNIVKDDPATNYETQKNITKALENNDKSFLVSAHDNTQYENILPYLEAVEAGNVPTASAWASYKLFYGEESCFGIYNRNREAGAILLNLDNGYRTETMTRQWGTLVQMEDQFLTEIIIGNAY